MYLWGLDAAFADDLNEASLQQLQTLSCISVVGLVQMLREPAARGRHQVVAGHAGGGGGWGSGMVVRNVGQSLLWGVGKVVALEDLELTGRND